MCKQTIYYSVSILYSELIPQLFRVSNEFSDTVEHIGQNDPRSPQSTLIPGHVHPNLFLQSITLPFCYIYI